MKRIMTEFNEDVSKDMDIFEIRRKIFVDVSIEKEFKEDVKFLFL